ncbi:MAG TPA: AAA family ATPase [Chthoniobacterales bacterium]|nr:AAA family ATPase [Chthoniobacterales bacterium]
MSPTQKSWRLEKVSVTNLLGFQGTKEYKFSPTLQVLEAPNHTGKASLTFALLWGMTGTIPALPRINRKSFRLFNKHAGETAKSSVVVELAQGNAEKMTIQRTYSGARSDVDVELTVDLNEKNYTGQDAQNLIFDELGVKPNSLEGCGIVLQDHRLGLITGQESAISDVINDMLGLYTLSQLVPILEEKVKEANDLKKEVDAFIVAADPVAKWVERDTELRTGLSGSENDAIDAGFLREDLEDTKGTAIRELASVATTLSAIKPAAAAKITAEVERLRNALGTLRTTTPISAELAELQRRANELDQRWKSADRLSKDFSVHAKKLVAESAKGEMDRAQLSGVIADKDAALENNKATREALEQEQGLLTVAYNHLLSHQKLESCPVCEGVVDTGKLLRSLKLRIADSIARELERLKEEDESHAAQRNTAAKRLKTVNTLRDEEHRPLVERLLTFAQQIKETSYAWTSPIDSDALFLDAEARNRLIRLLDEAVQKASDEKKSAENEVGEKQTALAKQEAELFQPAETNINRVRDFLVPIIEAVEKIEAHGKLRDSAEQRKSDLTNLREEAQTLAGQLRKITGALSKHEEESASAAVKARMPRISGFFRSVAQNPDYDGLDIQTTLSRDKVAYKIQATSAQLGNLNDAVGHVLSEGDLSAAAMSLLLGLASGTSHNLGFIVLDDPAQGMDDTLQANFANALAKLEDRKQVVILTHQRSFAEALERAGASRCKLGTWKLGKLKDE